MLNKHYRQKCCQEHLLSEKPWLTYLQLHKAYLRILLIGGFFLDCCCTFQAAEVTWIPARTSLKTECSNSKTKFAASPALLLNFPTRTTNKTFSAHTCYSCPCEILMSPNHTQGELVLFTPILINTDDLWNDLWAHIHASIRTNIVVHFNNCSLAELCLKEFQAGWDEHQNMFKVLLRHIYQHPSVIGHDGAKTGTVTCPGQPAELTDLPFPILHSLPATPLCDNVLKES